MKSNNNNNNSNMLPLKLSDKPYTSLCLIHAHKEDWDFGPRNRPMMSIKHLVGQRGCVIHRGHILLDGKFVE